MRQVDIWEETENGERYRGLVLVKEKKRKKIGGVELVHKVLVSLVKYQVRTSGKEDR